MFEPETARLKLRQWQASDLAPFADLNSDPRVMEHFPAPLTREESNAWVGRLKAEMAEQGWGLWAVEVKATQQFIGFVGLKVPKVTLPFSPCVEIGWRLVFDAWGKGYATEAAKAALQVGFEELNLTEIVSFTAVCNTRSAAVMQRIGMTKDPHTFEHPAVVEGHHLRTHVLYRMTREMWMQR
ncbi:MAG: GNAT family N-acetyltransferase [Pirellulales bacterium]